MCTFKSSSVFIFCTRAHPADEHEEPSLEPLSCLTTRRLRGELLSLCGEKFEQQKNRPGGKGWSEGRLACGKSLPRTLLGGKECMNRVMQGKVFALDDGLYIIAEL